MNNIDPSKDNAVLVMPWSWQYMFYTESYNPQSTVGSPCLTLTTFKISPYQLYVPVYFKTTHSPPPRQTPGHLTFLKKFGQIPRYVASFDGQMPHPLEL